MQRKALVQLFEWKNSSRRKPLIHLTRGHDKDRILLDIMFYILYSIRT